MNETMDLDFVDESSSLMEIDIDTNPSRDTVTTAGATTTTTSMRTFERCGPSNIKDREKVSSPSSISLLEGKLDRYAMDIILSYLTLVEYSKLSIASRIMKDAVSISTHLHMDEYGLFRKRKIPSMYQQAEVQETTTVESPSPSPPELLVSCITPQKEFQQLMNRFNNVSVLNLQGLAPVGDDLIDILNRCPSVLILKSITLHSCALSYWCAHSFRLRNLESLTLTGNSIRARMTFLLKHSKNLKSLTFKQCPALRDGDIAGISSILNMSLEELVLNHTKLSKPVASFPTLTRASFAGGFCLTSLSRFDCPNLKSLNLSFCVRLSEIQIEKIVENSPLLETLVIVKCAGVHSLDLESKSLRRLDAGFTHNLRDLRLACPALRQLDVSELNSIDSFEYLLFIYCVWCSKIVFDYVSLCLHVAPF
jgi:Leucine-rich repeat (LRR) protein